MDDIYEKPHFTVEISGGCKVGVENVLHQTTKTTFLRQIWLNNSFGVCDSDVVLTLYGGEKKSTRESPLENRCRLQHYVATAPS